MVNWQTAAVATHITHPHYKGDIQSVIQPYRYPQDIVGAAMSLEADIKPGVGIHDLTLLESYLLAGVLYPVDWMALVRHLHDEPLTSEEDAEPAYDSGFTNNATTVVALFVKNESPYYEHALRIVAYNRPDDARWLGQARERMRQYIRGTCFQPVASRLRHSRLGTTLINKELELVNWDEIVDCMLQAL